LINAYRKQEPVNQLHPKIEDCPLTRFYTLCPYCPGVEPPSGRAEEAGLKRIVLRFLADESGATAIEYGLIAAGISLAIIAAVNGIGGNLSTKFGDINTSLK
jgi:pilus assembly protein Flp/PilA